VYRIWAIPSTDPQTPPLHSTGAAFDCTIQNENGNALFMGSPIDENSPRSNPDHYANDPMPEGRMAHENRMFLINLMKAEGFCHHPEEWWHFSIGDQLWAWLERQKHGTDAVRAVYGSAEELLKNAPNL
jgi:D-alanyl-D-alanine dipeptidase